MQFLIVMQDNPYLVDYIKPAPKSKAYKWADLTRHLSVIGAAVLMMSADVQVAEEKEDKKKKWGIKVWLLVYLYDLYC